jgi:hypothetical protein
MKRSLAWGAVVLSMASAAPSLGISGTSGAECPACGTQLKNGAFTVMRSDGTRVTYACPKCALGTEDMRKAASATATDYGTREPIDARSAFYVIGSRKGPCCPPYWVAFASRRGAEDFAAKNGGEVTDFGGASVYFSLKKGNPERERYENPYHDHSHEHDQDR